MASSNERKLFRVSVIFILIIAVISSMIISLIWGSTPVSLAEIWHTLWSSELTDTSSQAGVIIFILFPGYDHIVPLVAFLGAMAAAMMVYALAWKNGVRPSRIILAGVAVAAFLGSGISALLVFYGDRVQGALLWMVGGLAARSWPQVEVLFPYALVGLIFACLGAKRLTILSLGDETAKGLGLKVEQTRFIMTAVAALLAAGAVSIAG
ncbi:MAG: iron chelate uptake ABC transporter family permease subunit, partial [Veillonella sp.]|nr:iron chelate uptake ABC transporter family permease subunit [Veillonella sp.]